MRGVFQPHVVRHFGWDFHAAARTSGVLSAGDAATGHCSASFYLTAALGAAAAGFMPAERLLTVVTVP